MRISTDRMDISGAVTTVNIEINKEPDTCPVCHHGMAPKRIHAFADQKKQTETAKRKALQVVYKCPLANCRNLFIARFKPTVSDHTSFALEDAVPFTFRESKFSDKITSISNEFEAIYNEAASAESQGMLHICGPGYRKALEYLIKDYLIMLDTAAKEEIEKEFLGKSIKDRVANVQIKTVAQRAVWLGNDETHYVRKWEDKDLQDQKKLILATVNWIEQEELLKDIIEDMPEDGAPTTGQGGDEAASLTK